MNVTMSGSTSRAAPASQAGAAPPEVIESVPVRRPGRWVAAALVGLAAVWVVYTLITNDAFQWSVVGHYFFAAEILKGLGMTIALTALTMLVGVVLGVVLAVMRLSRTRSCPRPRRSMCGSSAARRCWSN